MAVMVGQYARELVDALTGGATRVRSMTLRIAHGEAVTVVVERFVDSSEIGGLPELIAERFELVEKNGDS